MHVCVCVLVCFRFFFSHLMFCFAPMLPECDSFAEGVDTIYEPLAEKRLHHFTHRRNVAVRVSLRWPCVCAMDNSLSRWLAGLLFFFVLAKRARALPGSHSEERARTQNAHRQPQLHSKRTCIQAANLDTHTQTHTHTNDLELGRRGVRTKKCGDGVQWVSLLH